MLNQRVPQLCQQCHDFPVQLAQAEEGPVSQRGEYPPFHDLNRHLDLSLVFWLSNLDVATNKKKETEDETSSAHAGVHHTLELQKALMMDPGNKLARAALSQSIQTSS